MKSARMKVSVLLLLFFSNHLVFAQINTRTISGESLDCILAGIEISKFRSENIADVQSWKVVIGKQIKYRARGKKSGNWNWSVNNYDLMDFTNQSEEPDWKNKGSIIIPTNQLPMTNEELGVNTITAEKDNGDMDSHEIEVFFAKDDPNHHNPDVPNWFYYWSKIPIIQNMLEIPGIALWQKYNPEDPDNIENCSFVAPKADFVLNLKYAGYPYTTEDNKSIQYGNQNFNVLLMKRDDIIENAVDPSAEENCGFPLSNLDQVVYDYGDRVGTINIGQGCGFRKKLKDGSSIEGVYAFYSTVVHEVEHALIDCQLWETGYSTSNDQDNDGYPDSWEMMPQNGITFTVSSTFDNPPYDTYGFNKDTGDPEPYNSDSLGQIPPKYSAGTEYEEARCRDKEVLLKSNHNNLDKYDWSYDNGLLFNQINQGKKWK